MDIYYTIKGAGESQYREKMSRFLSFALPVCSADEARQLIKDFQNRYHDARHVCWAYMLGPERAEWQVNDNGEPSGTAGRPILGQINSRGLTDVLVVVVRYFGGIKLGTSGLIAAYREAASLALDEAGIKEMRRKRRIRVTFGYETADRVMRVVKSPDVDVISKRFDNLCSVEIEFPLDAAPEIEGKLFSVEGSFIEELTVGMD
jgi:uncharacterized YigZ family protein